MKQQQQQKGNGAAGHHHGVKKVVLGNIWVSDSRLNMERFKSVKPTLTIVNRHGPCSTLHPADQKLSLEQILSIDQSRVDSIHHQISAISGKGKTSGPLSSSQITAQYGSSFGVNAYIIKVGIGTPSKTLTLAFDTGSDVTWTQCKPYISNTDRTPITKKADSGPYYYITMTGLSIAGDTLPICSTVFSKAGTIIDSGTTFTQLPPDAYQALRSAFRKHMTQYKMVLGISLFDTCYDFTGFDNVTIPTVGIQFLNNVSLDLDPDGIIYMIPNSQGCLAFASNSDPSGLGIFGNVQQKTFNVVYDIPNGEIGFSPNAC
ncbi:aspartyl protease family protein At5g10770-like [Carex rostrata]